MSDKVYIAAALFNPQQLRVVSRIKAIVQTVGMDYFSPAEMSSPIWRGRKPADCTQDERRQVLDGNINGLHDCRILIARVSGETKEVDTGVAWEMGYFDAILRREEAEWGPDRSGDIAPEHRIAIAYLEPQDRHQSLNLMLAETVSAAVYGDAQLHALLSDIQTANGADEMRQGALLREALAEHAPDKIIKHEREPIGLEEDGTARKARVHTQLESPTPRERKPPRTPAPGFESAPEVHRERFA